MTVTVYRSTDASAPPLTAIDGALLSVLNACLVNGYGAKPAAGWTKAFEAVNSRTIYRNNPTTGSGQYLWVRDDILTNKRWARVRGAKNATSIDNLVTAFPSQVTLSALQSGCAISKSAANDAIAREWVLIADDKTFILMIKTGEVANEWSGTYAGDIDSITGSAIFGLSARFVTTDATAITSNATSPLTATAPALAQEQFGQQQGYGQTTTQNGASHIHIAEHPISALQSPYVGRMAEDYGTNHTVTRSGAQGAGYPALGGGILMTKNQLYVTSGSIVPIGTMRGVWSPLHNRPLANNDTFSGSGAYAGKTFEAFNMAAGGQLIIETSDTW
jgi:hypothetical protein